MKTFLAYVLKAILLSLVMTVTFIASSLAVGVRGEAAAPPTSLLPIIAYAVVNAIVVMIFIVHARDRGWKLIAITAGLYWGIQFFMTQIETLYFIASVNIPLDVIVRTVLSGALNAVLFSILAVWILGKFTKGETQARETSISAVAIKAVLVAILYVMIYFLFGYYVAYSFPGVREYYVSSAPVMNSMLILFQVLRGLLWFGIVLLLYTALASKGWKAYVITALMLGILIASPLFFDNPYMPGAVRLGHFFELTSSMFTFGLLTVFIITRTFSFNTRRSLAS